MEDKDAAKDDEEKKEKGAGGDEGGDDGLGDDGSAAKKKKKMILMGGVAALLLIGGGAGLYFSGVLGGSKPPAAEGAASSGEAGKAEGEHGDAKEAKKETKEKDGEAAKPTFYPLGDILVNLAGDPKHPNFLKVTINLELADEKDKAAIDALKPRIIDDFQVYLRELRVEDLRGSAGLYRLREELLLRISETVKPVRIRDVLFQEVLVQ